MSNYVCIYVWIIIYLLYKFIKHDFIKNDLNFHFLFLLTKSKDYTVEYFSFINFEYKK